jgi:glutathione S-transferase
MTDFLIYGVPASVYVRSVAVALEEKGIRYGVNALAPFEARSEAYLLRNPFGRVPTLVHGDFELYETQAILRYLDRVVPGPLFTPEDLRAQARMNQLCGITDWYVMPQITMGVAFDRLIAPKIGLPVDEARIAASIPLAKVCVAEIARLLGDQPFLAGDTLSIADLLAGPHLSFFARTTESEAILEPHSKLSAWIARMNARPSFQNTTTEKLAARAQVRVDAR